MHRYPLIAILAKLQLSFFFLVEVESSDINRMSNSPNPNDPSTTILMLNDDCLENILRRLSRPDRISFAQTCSRFLVVYQQNSKVLDKLVTLRDLNKFSSFDRVLFFKLSGHHVRFIKRSYNYTRNKLWGCLGTYCINLESMTLYGNKLTVDDMSKIFPKLNYLQNLELIDCGLNDNCLLKLNHLTQLKNLNLSENGMLTGLNMNHLPASIESLDLSYCCRFFSKLLPIICKALPQLKELNIEGINTEHLNLAHLVNENCCDSLETLTMTIYSHEKYEHIARLPNLKNIILCADLASSTSLRSELLSMLLEHKSKQLRHFELSFDCYINSGILLQIGKLSALRKLILPDNDAVDDRDMKELRNLQELEEIDIRFCKTVNNNAVLQLILACRKLHVLHLRECHLLTNELLSQIVLKLRLQISQKSQRTLPIKIYVDYHYSKLTSDNTARDIIELYYE